MYGLPASTLVNRPLYKKAVFEKFNLKTAERDRFDADVSRMAIVAYISPKKVSGLNEGQDVKEFYVLQVQLKKQDYDAKNILLLHKLIPQKIVFALDYDQQTQFCIFHTRLQQSSWEPTKEAAIPLKGLTLDDVWNNIVAEIGGLDNSAEETLEQQIIHREEREKLLQQIESLEKRCRTEKQTRKKYELHQQLLKLKEELKSALTAVGTIAMAVVSFIALRKNDAQVDEMKRQWEEDHRPYINVMLENNLSLSSTESRCLKIENYGKGTANNVKLIFDETFINNIPVGKLKEDFLSRKTKVYKVISGRFVVEIFCDIIDYPQSSKGRVSGEEINLAQKQELLKYLNNPIRVKVQYVWNNKQYEESIILNYNY